MGDLLGSPRVAPLFLGLAGYHSGLPLIVPMGSALPIANGAWRSSIRSPDRKIRVVEIPRLGIFTVFCRVQDPIVRGRSAETARPLFLGLAGYHSVLPLVVPMDSALPIAIGAGRSSIRSTDRKIRAFEIARLGFFHVFCRVEDPIVRGRSTETAGFLDSLSESFGWKCLVEGMGPVGDR